MEKILKEIRDLLFRQQNVITVERTQSDICVFGLRRSGNHALIYWLLEHWSGDRRHFNNCKINPDGTVEILKSHINFLAGGDGGVNLLSFEDHPLDYVNLHLTPSKHPPVLILRDPFNTFASRLKIVRTDAEESHRKANAVDHLAIYLWKQYAKEYLGETDYLRGAVKINFNTWFKSKVYRKNTSQSLDSPIRHTDAGFGSKMGWEFSRGSSFEAVNEVTTLDLMNRWKYYEDDQEYLALFDEELIDLSRRIFGEPPPLRFFKKKSRTLESIQALVEKATGAATLLCKQGKDEKAAEMLRQALKVEPNNTAVLRMLGVVQNKLMNNEEAIANLSRAIELEPDNAEGHNNISLCYTGVDTEKAIKHAEKAVELVPENPSFLNNLGLQYKNADKGELAIEAMLKSLEYKIDPYVMTNLGSVYMDELNLEKGAEYLESAISLRPGLSGAHVNLFYCYQLMDKYKEAWVEYEHRLNHYPMMIAYLNRYGVNKKWNGTDDLKGKRVLVFCEQGIGDGIQFVRFLPKLKERGCYIILSCSLVIANLFETCEGVDEIHLKDVEGDLPEYDYHIPIISLPHLLEYYSIPNEPYIKGEPTFGMSNKTVNVGVCWKGNPRHPNDHRRSVEAKYFNFEIPGVRVYSLQKNASDELKDANISDMACELFDFKDTAEAIASLDLIISVDTAVLHLAGAMGKEAWGLLPYKPDWRWGLGVESPWYPSIRLFRQHTKGDWDEVFARVNAFLTCKSPGLADPPTSDSG